MDSEIETTYHMLELAEFPEDVFGKLKVEDTEGQKQQLLMLYKQLAKVLHPDRYRSDSPEHRVASAAFPILSEFYERARARVEQGIYGTQIPDDNTEEDEQEGVEFESEEVDFVIQTRKRRYHFNSAIAEGDLSVLYNGAFEEEGVTTKVVAKIIKDPSDNDLAQNEIKVLRTLWAEPSNYSKHLPKFYDQFKTSNNQLGLIISHLDAFDLYSVRKKYREGVPEKHMVWMLSRLLSVLGYAHSKGIIHGNIDPSHLMIRPGDHNLFLIDWSYAAINPFRTGDGFKVWSEHYSAPEVAERKRPIPASDLYAVGKCMIFLLGGDVRNNSLPAQVDEKIQRLIIYFVRESPLQRAQDAWEMHTFLRKLMEELWGPRKFLEFEM
jgi:serine/threonine protein kinase